MKLDALISKINEFQDDGYSVLNVFYNRKTDSLVVQFVKDKKVISITCSVEVPVYRFSVDYLLKEKNILLSMYLMKKTRCEKIYVKTKDLYMIGRRNQHSRYMLENFSISDYVVYNVMRPEYYVTTHKDIKRSQIDDVRIASLDIEIMPDTLEFASPMTAKFPIDLATIFDFDTFTAHVYYMNSGKIIIDEKSIRTKILKHFENTSYIDLANKISVKYYAFGNEVEFLRSLLEGIFSYGLVTGWNVTEFDMDYIINRCEQCGLKVNHLCLRDRSGVVYLFSRTTVIDYLLLYKWIVEKNPQSMKLASIGEKVLGISKIGTESFLDIAYNIVDCFLVFLLENSLSLLRVLFEFAQNGALLHVFNVSNILEPYLYRLVDKHFGMSFITNRYTVIYNTYFNNIYKIVNKSFYEKVGVSYDISNYGRITDFIKNYELYEDHFRMCLKKNKESDEQTEKVYSIQTLLNQISRGDPDEKQVEKFKNSVKKEENSISNIDEFIRDYFGLLIDNISTYIGAFNKAFVGMEKNIIDLDFFSMYPTIMYVLNISFETACFYVPIRDAFGWCYDRENYMKMNKDEGIIIHDFRKNKFFKISRETLIEKVFKNSQLIVSNLGVIYSKKAGFIPKFIEYLLKIRTEYKKKMQDETDPVLKKKYYSLQLFYKIYANSIYGYFGYLSGVLFNLFLVATVTNMGRMEIMFANYKVNKFLRNLENKHYENKL